MKVNSYNKLLILLTLVLCVNSMSATTFYVDANAVGANDGTSWANAFVNLQDAINVTAQNDEIWVAANTYYPTEDISGDPNPLENEDKTFLIDKNIKIYGGFNGTETLLAQRDVMTNVTVLSGDLDMNNQLTGGNAYHVVYITRDIVNISNEMILDGFTITLGNAAGENIRCIGGGIFIHGVEVVCNPTISNCIITDNEALIGGGLYCLGSSFGEVSPIVTNCVFNNNQASLGGAVFNEGVDGGKSNSVFTNCHFINNFANYEGGAIFNAGAFDGTCEPVFTDCTFTNNTADGGGGAIYNDSIFGNCHPVFTNTLFDNNSAVLAGGAIFNNALVGELYTLFEGCTFLNNIAGQGNIDEGDGGAIYNYGEAGDCSVEITNTTFSNNQSDNDGGAIYNDAREGNVVLIINGSTFDMNISKDDGGAIYTNNENGLLTLSIVGSIFKNNSAVENGGVYFLLGGGLSDAVVFNSLFIDNNAQHEGSVFSIDDGIEADLFVANCTFSGNTSPSSAVVAIRHWDTGMEAPIFMNSIFWDNDQTFAPTAIGTGEINMDYCLIQEPNCPTGLTCTANMIFNQDPKFTDSNNSDFTLTACSPAVNAGINDVNTLPVDLALAPRIHDTTIDLGCYEFISTAGVDSLPPVMACQDLTIALGNCGNYILDTNDILILLGDTEDNITNFDDLIIDISQTHFDCSMIGMANTITITATDEAGNAGMCTAAIIIDDSLFPNETIFVNINGTGGNGASWDGAQASLQNALKIAQTCPDRFDAIWIAMGVYYPDIGCDIIDNDRSASFEIVEGVSLYGGFLGFETSLSERDIANFQAILSGDIDENDNQQPIISDTDEIVGGNSHSIVTVPANITGATTLDGLTITAGYADGNILSPIKERVGAGVFNKGSIGLNETEILGNKAISGAGIYNAGLNGMITSMIVNSRFRNNEAIGSGGALYNDGRGSGICIPTVVNCEFLNNESLSAGGAVYNDGSSGGDCSPTFVNCDFSQNAATTGGSSMYNYFSNSFIYNTIFYADASGINQIITDHHSVVTIEHSTVEGNYQNQNNANPVFTVMPAANVPQEIWDLSLLPSSPAINSGDVTYLPANITKDLAGNPRVNNGQLDMGAYEFQSAPLPIELTVFEAELTSRQEVRLNWVTTSEFNSSHFIIEKSRDGIHFEPIATKPAVGQSEEVQRYTHVDETPYQGNNYYRLQQVDLDGSFEYSIIRVVQMDLGQVSIYPNPARDLVNLALTEYAQSTVSIEVANIAGAILYKGEIKIENKIAAIELKDIGVYMPGTYFATVSTVNKQPVTMKFIKVK